VHESRIHKLYHYQQALVVNHKNTMVFARRPV
jgi:hypothetical protein